MTTDSFLTLIRELEYPYFPGAIFPSEMTLFLHECDRAHVEWIIESGRQDGYSTAAIAAYARLRGIRADSIDFEGDPQRALACRERLARSGGITLHAGDTFRVLPEVLRSGRGRIALLIDGPKGDAAITLSSVAAASCPVAVVGHHNTAPDTPWYPRFVAAFGPAAQVENSPVARSPLFQEFREWERTLTAATQRDLEHSSLSVSVLPSPGPRIGCLWHGTAAHQARATALYLAWKLRGDRLAVAATRARRVGGRLVRGMRS